MMRASASTICSQRLVLPAQGSLLLPAAGTPCSDQIRRTTSSCKTERVPDLGSILPGLESLAGPCFDQSRYQQAIQYLAASSSFTNEPAKIVGI
jgi:hypothetical protein